MNQQLTPKETAVAVITSKKGHITDIIKNKKQQSKKENTDESK